MQRKCLPLIFALLCMAFGRIDAQENYNISSINQYYHNWYDGVNDVCIRGGYAYLACNSEGLRIEDISDPGSIQDIGRCPIGDTAYDYATAVAVSGDYAYLGTYDNAILVIDVSNPAAPQRVHSIPLSANKNAIRIAGNYAFVCTYGLTIIDISDPTNAQVVWRSEDSFEVDDIEIHGDTAYVAFSEHGLKILDISQITSPQVIASFGFDDGTWVTSASISGDYAYMACGGRGFQVLNLKTMQIIAGIDSLSYAFRIKVRDSYAYMTYGDPECPLAIVDISDPYAPQTMGIYHPPQDIVNFALNDDLVYCADYYHGLRMIDITEPQNPHEEYVYSRYGHDLDVTICNNYAFVREDYKIAAIDISDFGNPDEEGYFEFASEIKNICFAGNTAFTCHQANTCLNAVDFSNPSSPSLLGSYTAEHDVHYRVAIYEHYAYLLENLGLRIVDISNPAAMSQVGFFHETASTGLLEIFDHYAIFQGVDQELVLLDLSDPISPAIIERYNIGAGENCFTAMKLINRLYLASYHKLWIFDVSDLQNWQQLSVTIITDEPYVYLNGIDVVGNFVYTAIGKKGLRIYDVTDGANPRFIGFYQTPGYAQNVAVVGNVAVVADYTNLGFYDCTQAVAVDEPATPTIPQSFELLQNYPNPFNSSTTIQFDLPKPGHVSMTVFDILGRSVSTLADREFAAGRHAIRWDGTAANGKPAASGRYFVRAASGETARNMPIMLLK